LPAVSEWSDFDDCHVEALCVCFQMSVSVRVNMIQPKNDQDRFTAERVLRTRPKTYRAIVLLLADPGAAVMHIAKRHRVSEHTVRAIRAREAVAIAERKQRLTSIFANVAEIAAERMEELAGQANLRDAGTTAGIATDKLLALSGDVSTTVRHLHSFDLSNDDLLAFALQRSKQLDAEKRAQAAVVEVPALPAETHLLAGKTPHKKTSLPQALDG
jgi:hypothetical protein